jgi:hypothetical protein
MPYKDPEKRREAQRRHFEKNRESILEKKRLFYSNNKDKDYYKRETYADTYQFKKTHTISNWKYRGVVGDYDSLYEMYIKSTHCDVCKKEYKNIRDRCLDHDHETGLFRQFLCTRCNVLDNWMKFID